VRKYPSCKKVLREVKEIMKISLVNTNGKNHVAENGKPVQIELLDTKTKEVRN
jgi:hypothetical protein